MAMSVRFERGDLVGVHHVRQGEETQSVGVVIDLDDGLLSLVLPHGVEVWNMRSTLFVRTWRIEHTPGAMTEEEALAHASRRLQELRRHPLVMVEPGDEPPFRLEPHEHDHREHAHVRW
ncbi:MAG: hypothetical protein U0360_09630 [Dehalococcoidia bacterium]